MFKWLRGDAIKGAADIYFHIDPEDVRRSCLAHVPPLGINDSIRERFMRST